MPSVLHDLPKSEALEALGSVTAALSANPGIESDKGIVRVPATLEQRIISDLRDQLHLKPDDNSERSRAKVFEALIRWMESLTTAHKEEEIRSRLGAAGDLPLAQYSIQINPDVAEFFSYLKTSKRDFRDGILKATDVEHLSKKLPDNDGGASSVFVRAIGLPGTTDFHYLIVQAHRLGATLQCNAAFRLFASEVTIPNQARPVQLLRLFAHKYGFRFKFPTSDWMYFSSGEIVPNSTTVAPPHAFKVANTYIELEDQEAHNVFTPTLAFQSPQKLIETMFVYAVDTKAYVKDLQAHGIHAQVPAQGFSFSLYWR